jgi:hypothetical protein
MTNTKHTPGPWKVQPGEISLGPYNKGLMVGPLQYAKVHVVGPFEKPLDEETRANARLVAAAPELLAMLQEVSDWNRADIRGFDDISPNMEMLKARQAALRAAIAKVEG